MGVGLPEKENEIISHLKSELEGKEELSSPPHITLKKPFFVRNESYLLQKLTKWSSEQNPFKVSFKQVATFRHSRQGTVILLPNKGEDFKRLERGLSEEIPILPVDSNYTPHLTMANRLPLEEVDLVKQKVREWKLELDLKVESVTLYKRFPPEVWREYRTFRFGGEQIG